MQYFQFWGIYKKTTLYKLLGETYFVSLLGSY